MPIDHDTMRSAAEDVARSPFTAGLFGALVTAMRGMPGSTIREKAAHSFSGALLAGFVGPGVSDWFGLTSESLLSAGAFLVGMFGLNISAAVWSYIKTMNIGDFIPFGKGGEK